MKNEHTWNVNTRETWTHVKREHTWTSNRQQQQLNSEIKEEEFKQSTHPPSEWTVENERMKLQKELKGINRQSDPTNLSMMFKY